MHVLGRGFGSRRKSSQKRPRDLHIRKVSFSGSSLSSGCSLSSSTSSTPVATPIARTPTNAFRPEIDPLQLNPAFHAPPRLFERPFKNTQPLPEVCDEDEEENVMVSDVDEDLPTEKALPSLSHQDDSGCETQEPSDYFFTALAPPPPPRQAIAPRASPVPRSRWSESTIATIDFEVNQDGDEEDDATSDSDDEDVLEMRRLSRRLSRRSSHRAAALQTLSLNITYSRPAAPKRPPMRSLDSVDNYIRRGGWKRRGIVFRAEDAEDMETVTREPERASL